MSDYRTDEWRAWRAAGLGSADIPVVAELSPWKSRYTLWTEKAGLVTEEDDETEAMEFGRYAEDMVARYFHDRTGLTVAGEQTWMTGDEDWMHATADGFVFDGARCAECGHDVHELTRGLLRDEAARCDHFNLLSAAAVLEIKTTSDPVETWERDGIPAHYQCQGQWLMAVSGMDRCWFAVLHLAFGRPRFRAYELERDEEDIAWLTAEARSFWNLVQTGTPPALDGFASTTTTLQRRWEANRGAEVEIALSGETLIARIRDAQADVDMATGRLNGLKNELRALMGDATEAMVDGRTVATWRPSSEIDLEALLADLDPDEAAAWSRFDTAGWAKAHRKRAEKYRTITGARRLLLKEDK